MKWPYTAYQKTNPPHLKVLHSIALIKYLRSFCVLRRVVQDSYMILRSTK